MCDDYGGWAAAVNLKKKKFDSYSAYFYHRQRQVAETFLFWVGTVAISSIV